MTKLKVGDRITMYNPEVLKRFNADFVVVDVIQENATFYILEVVYPPHADGEWVYANKGGQDA